MKLRNKKTGEIGQIHLNCGYAEGVINVREPEEYWFIDAHGNIMQNRLRLRDDDEGTDVTALIDAQKAIGNYFETKEEAKKAVEKLKTLKRLRDKGFRFMRNIEGVFGNEIKIFAMFTGLSGEENDSAYYDNKDDLDLLFGGGE